MGCRFCGLGTRFRRLCVRLRRFGRRVCAGFGRVSGLGGVGIVRATYGAVVAVPSVGCVAALFITTSAGVPVPVIVGGPGGGEIVGVAQCRLDHITAGGASLGGVFRSSCAGEMGGLIFHVATNIAHVPVFESIFTPVAAVLMCYCAGATAEVTFRIAGIIIAVSTVGTNTAEFVCWVNNLVACTFIVPDSSR